MIVFIGWTADYDRIMIQQLREHFEIKNIAYPEGRLFFRLNMCVRIKPSVCFVCELRKRL